MGENLSLRVMALNGKSGDTLWDTEVFSYKEADLPKIHQKNSQASPTPFFSNEKLFVHFGHLGTACVGTWRGRVLWRYQFPYAPVHGNGGSPVLVGDHQIFTADSRDGGLTVAMEKGLGEIAWQTARVTEAKRTFSFSTPLLITLAGGEELVISPGSGVVQALDPKSGAEQWRVNYDQGYSVVPRPVYADGILYVCTGYDKPHLLAIKVEDGMSGDVTESHVLWRMEKLASLNPSPLVVDGLLYCVADSGVLSCMDAVTGKLHYQERCTGPISASILHAKGRLYLTDEQGKTVVVAVGKNYKVLASNELGERVQASLGVLGNDLILRTESHLYRINGER
jgi:outer membrane protein assembly factor BamB